MSNGGQDAVDIELVKKNALEQGIALQEIALLYAGLDETEKQVFVALKLVKFETEKNVAATFTDSGDALFPSKVVGVYYLGAD